MSEWVCAECDQENEVGLTPAYLLPLVCSLQLGVCCLLFGRYECALSVTRNYTRNSSASDSRKDRYRIQRRAVDLHANSKHVAARGKQ
jgi:hypothetical protein